jgi:hypothetical protein
LVVDVEEEGGKERKGSNKEGKETQHKSNHGLKP